MTKRSIRDVAASVRHRLQNNARLAGRPFQEVLQYYAMERFLFRLAQSAHVDKFVLKGALMLTAWRAPQTRPTKDIDFLGHMPNSIEPVITVIRDVCSQPVELDGSVFDPDSVKGLSIKEDADYEGIRVTLRGSLQNARIAMQIDIGFGDIVVPGPQPTEYPTILGDEPPRLRGYSRETAVAEKFEAMVKLGLLNSRMKDFYDIWLLSRQFDFDGVTLASAVEKTFLNRNTSMTRQPAAFSQEFIADPAKTAQWRAFLRKSRLADAPSDLAIVIQAISQFLGPIAAAITDRRAFSNSWLAPGPWRQS